jgi:hypothetical protein
MSFPDDEEEIDYENDDSWYENAMNELDSASNNHDTIYSEDEIKDLSDFDKTIIRHRNFLLQNGFEFTELQNGDHIQEIIGRSGVIHLAVCNFTIIYKRDNNYVAIFQMHSEDETIQFPIQLAALIYTGKHLGCYQFVEFYHLEEELPEDQKDLNGISINRELTYKGKPSFQFYKSDKEELNREYIEKMTIIDPRGFEFVDEYLIIELKEDKSINEYLPLIEKLQY